MRSSLLALLVLVCLPAGASAASFAGRPTKRGGLTLSAAVQGPDVALATGRGFARRFWPGVNLGATVPGTQPGELAATRAEYDRWLRGMGALGARVVRVYTILRPAFYDALAAYNRRHARAPLRFIQGVWIPEDRFLATGDAYDPAVTSGFDAELADAVAVIHGKAHLPVRPGHASGTYRADVSRWLLAWSPGTEWDPQAVRSTDARHAGTPAYQGRYIAAAPDATPMTEAGAMDAAMLRDIKGAGMAGGIVFEYLDEWFKRTWNTEAVSQPVERRALWKNVLTNETQFGLVAAEPPRCSSASTCGLAAAPACRDARASTRPPTWR